MYTSIKEIDDEISRLLQIRKTLILKKTGEVLNTLTTTRNVDIIDFLPSQTDLRIIIKERSEYV